MTVLEAEKIYRFQVKDITKKHKKACKRRFLIFLTITLILLTAGAIMLIISSSIPPEIDSFGIEWDTTEAFTLNLFGSIMTTVGGVFLLICVPLIRYKHKKEEPNLLSAIKNLYLNYLQCVDMTKNEKLYYIQKLEEIRNAELACAIQDASANVSAAILFSTLR